MKTIFFGLALLLFTQSAFSKEVDFLTVEVCRSRILGKFNENAYQTEINQKLKEALNKKSPSRVIMIQYGNDVSGFFRSKDSACIVATAWYEV